MKPIKQMVVLSLLISAIGFAKVSLNPDSATVLPGQCFPFAAHFSAPTKNGEVRQINLSTEPSGLAVFASGDCSGGAASTISGSQVNFQFSALPAAGTVVGKKFGVHLTVTDSGEAAHAKIVIGK